MRFNESEPLDDPSSFRVDVVDVEGQPVVRVQGEVDLSVAPEVWTCIEQVCSALGTVVIDVESVGFMDSSGINLLARAYQLTGQVREAVVVLRPQAAVRRVLAVSGIDEYVTIDPPTPDPPG